MTSAPVPRALPGLLPVVAVLLALDGGCLAAQKPHQFPGSPALQFLGSGPAQVMHPGTGRDLATELIQFVDPRGAVRQGAALDLAPWLLLPGMSIPLPAYQGSRLRYILANTTLSLASVRVSGEEGGTELGGGLRAVLLNQADPMADPAFTDRLRQALLACLPDQPDAPEEEIRDCHREARAGVLDDFLAERWNGAALAVGLAGGRVAPASIFDGTRRLGWAAWVSGAVPLGRRGQLALQGRVEDRGADPATQLRVADLSGRFTAGAASANGYVELGGRTILEGDGESGPLRWALGVEFRAGSAGWVTLGLGEGPAGTGRGAPAFLTGLRWDLSPGPRLAPDPVIR